MKILVLIVCILGVTQWSLGGAVNQPGSWPDGEMDSKGNFLLSGNWSSIAYYQDRFTRYRELSNNPDYIHNAAIANYPDSSKVGIVCAGGTIALFDKTRSVFTPGGYWSTLVDQENRGVFSGRFRCTISNAGMWAYYDIADEVLVTPQWQLAIPAGGDARLLSLNGFFALVTNRGDIHWINQSGDILATFDSPVYSLDPSFRIKGRGNLMIAIDSYVSVRLRVRDTELGGYALQSEHLAVAPVDDGQAPAISFGADGSFIVGGYWGTWLYRNNKREVLNIPIYPGDRGGFVVAHNGADQQFIATGADDTDWGSFGSIQLGSSLNSSSLRTSELPSEAFQMTAMADLWWYDKAGLKGFDELFDGVIPWESTTVAIIDSGVEVNHPDLLATFAIKEVETENQQDQDDNGFLDDRIGFDFVLDQSTPLDKFGHGTHVAGLAGWAQRERLHSTKILRALDRQGKSTSFDLARAIHYAIDEEVDIINCSWGGGRATVALQEAFARAHQAGIIVFTSAGNDKLNIDDSPQVPGNFPGVINIGAVDKRDRLSSFSNYGKETTMFLAPGTDIVSSTKDGSFGPMSGTSMAAPIAANVAARLLALIKARYPQEMRDQWRDRVLDLMCEGSHPEVAEGRSKCGRLDAAKSLNSFILTE